MTLASYNKTNWINNSTPVNASNMNHIEDAIYDNREQILADGRDISALQASVTTAEGNIGSLQTRMTNAETSISGLTTRVNNLDTAVGTLSSEVSEQFGAISQDLTRDNTAITNHAKSFADVETSPTSASHSAKELIIYNNRLYSATTAIAEGDVLNVGTNIQATSVGDQLYSLLTDYKKIRGIQVINVNYTSQVADKATATVTGTITTVSGANNYYFIPLYLNYGIYQTAFTRNGTTITATAMNVSGASHSFLGGVLVIAVE